MYLFLRMHLKKTRVDEVPNQNDVKDVKEEEEEEEGSSVIEGFALASDEPQEEVASDLYSPLEALFPVPNLHMLRLRLRLRFRVIMPSVVEYLKLWNSGGWGLS